MPDNVEKTKDHVTPSRDKASNVAKKSPSKMRITKAFKTVCQGLPMKIRDSLENLSLSGKSVNLSAGDCGSKRPPTPRYPSPTEKLDLTEKKEFLDVDLEQDYPIITHFDNLKKVCSDPEDVEKLEKLQKEIFGCSDDDEQSVEELSLGSNSSKSEGVNWLASAAPECQCNCHDEFDFSMDFDIGCDGSACKCPRRLRKELFTQKKKPSPVESKEVIDFRNRGLASLQKQGKYLKCILEELKFANHQKDSGTFHVFKEIRRWYLKRETVIAKTSNFAFFLCLLSCFQICGITICQLLSFKKCFVSYVTSVERDQFLQDLSWASTNSLIYARNIIGEISAHSLGFFYNVLTLLFAVAIYFGRSKLAEVRESLFKRTKFGFQRANKLALNFYKNLTQKVVRNLRLLLLIIAIVILVCIFVPNWQDLKDSENWVEDNSVDDVSPDEPETENNYAVGFPAPDVTILPVVLIKKLMSLVDYIFELYGDIKTNLGHFFFDSEF